MLECSSRAMLLARSSSNRVESNKHCSIDVPVAMLHSTRNIQYDGEPDRKIHRMFDNTCMQLFMTLTTLVIIIAPSICQPFTLQFSQYWISVIVFVLTLSGATMHIFRLLSFCPFLCFVCEISPLFHLTDYQFTILNEEILV